MAGISAAAGCVVSLVSGLFFCLCFKMPERATPDYEQLSQLQKLYVATRATARALEKNCSLQPATGSRMELRSDGSGQPPRSESICRTWSSRSF